MAWTTPKTWATDEIVLATGTGSLNEQIRDNLNALSVHAHSGSAGDVLRVSCGTATALDATVTVLEDV